MKQLHTSLTLSGLLSFHWLNRIHSDGVQSLDWIELSSVLRPHQHSIGSMGDGFYRSKDPTNIIKVLKEKATKENTEKSNNKIHTQIRNSTR